ncbi:hypothetical protein WA588_003681, partial [Blastocystis sp. NMH]
MEGDKREDILNGMPMHYSCHRVNYDCELPDSVIESEIPATVKEAKTFAELYKALNDMKTELESDMTIESVDITMDVPDDSTEDDSEVMIRMNIQELEGLTTSLAVENVPDNNDIYLGGGVMNMNPTMRMDYVNLTSMYSPVRGNQITRLSYETRHSLFSCPFSLSMEREYQNRLIESSVNVYSTRMKMGIHDRRGRYNLECGIHWRDLLPLGDIDEQRILRTQCSLSMLKECHPSLKSTLAFRYHYDTQDTPDNPTEGTMFDVSTEYNGFFGDVNSIKAECSLSTTIPLSGEIDQEPGLLLHLKGYGGMIQNLNRRRTRYVDRFFLNSRYVHGMDVRDFGPRSKPEEGGRKEGDVLGGDCCAAFSAALSLPVILSHEYSYNIRSKLFMEAGNVWNPGMRGEDILKSTRSVFGIGFTMPFMGM